MLLACPSVSTHALSFELTCWYGLPPTQPGLLPSCLATCDPVLLSPCGSLWGTAPQRCGGRKALGAWIWAGGVGTAGGWAWGPPSPPGAFQHTPPAFSWGWNHCSHHNAWGWGQALTVFQYLEDCNKIFDAVYVHCVATDVLSVCLSDACCCLMTCNCSDLTLALLYVSNCIHPLADKGAGWDAAGLMDSAKKAYSCFCMQV